MTIPTIKIVQTVSEPSPHHLKVFLDDIEISSWLTGLTITLGVDQTNKVVLEGYASIDIPDGLMADIEMAQAIVDREKVNT